MSRLLSWGAALSALLCTSSARAQRLPEDQLRTRPGASSDDVRAALRPVAPSSSVREFAKQAASRPRNVQLPPPTPVLPEPAAEPALARPRPSLSELGELLPSEVALIRLSPEDLPTRRAEVMAALGAHGFTELAYGWHAFQLPVARSPHEVDTLVSRLPGVRSYWPNRKARSTLLWNDPYLYGASQTRRRTQWYLHNNGYHEMEPGFDIDMARAWDTTTVNPMYVSRVAVIDSQVDLAHGDRPRYVLDCHIDALGNCGPRQSFSVHGTAVASLIGAATDNGVGMAGVNWAAEIIPIAVDSSDAPGDRPLDTNRIVAAIYYAVRNGAQVINASFGGDGVFNSLDNPEYAAIKYARDRDVIFVAAAGNSARNIDHPGFEVAPVGYNLDNIIGVAAVDEEFWPSNVTNFGPTSVDIAAPGDDLLTGGLVVAVPGGFDNHPGTSVAAPLVTGVVSLMKSLRPEASPFVIQNCLAIQPSAHLQGMIRLPGVISADGALTCVRTFGERTPPPPFNIAQPAHGTVARIMDVTFAWEAVADAAPRYDLFIDGAFVLRTSGTSATVQLPPGTHRWFVQASDIYGNWRNSNYEYYVTVDLHPSAPNVAGDGAVLNYKRPTYSWTASETAYGPITYFLEIDGSFVDHTRELSWTSPYDLRDGPHTLRVKACDTASRCTTSGTVNFRVDTQPPTVVAMQAPLNGAYVNSSIAFSWGAASDPSGISKYVLHVLKADRATFESYELSASTLSYTLASTRPEGDYSWFLDACDTMGFCSRANTYFRTDMTPPTGLSTVSPIAGSTTTDTTPTFTWTAASDAKSGVVRYELRVLNAGSLYTRSFPVGTTSGELSHSLDCAPSPGTRNTWSVAAFDAAGNSVVTPGVTFYCRTYRPKPPVE